MKINKVAVIGAGLMGSGIAAQVANAGFPVGICHELQSKKMNLSN